MGMQSREAAHEVIDNAMRELLEILSGGGDVVDENVGGRQEVAQPDLRGRARAFDLESDFTGDEVMRARREIDRELHRTASDGPLARPVGRRKTRSGGILCDDRIIGALFHS